MPERFSARYPMLPSFERGSLIAPRRSEESETMLLNAVSAAPRALAWLQQASSARVLHVFDRVCNLVNRENEIISLVTAEVGPGPFSLLLPLDTRYTFAQWIVPAAPVLAQENALAVGGLTVDLQNVPVWRPIPPWDELHGCPDKRRARMSLLRLMLSAHFGRDDRQRPAFGRLFGSHSDAFLNALASRDMAGCQAKAENLAGLGQGLTPAGDDWLMGALYALWSTWPVDEARPWASAILAAAAPRTTLLSAAWLKAAAWGEAGEPWHEFVETILGDQDATVISAVRRILATGHTSGADALAGYLAVVTQFDQNERP